MSAPLHLAAQSAVDVLDAQSRPVALGVPGSERCWRTKRHTILSGEDRPLRDGPHMS
ncbi:hypothetical protein ACFYZB_01325 [Streptomyces sp. NPDC001852]|uniref:hypothetical protein n=1 Tax=Streptomyces sp. NPDC001852 TaxID=3364619 RepID=UPI003695D15B